MYVCMSHISCLLSPASRLLFNESCLTSPVSCLTSPVWLLLSHISCLTYPVSCFTSPVSGVQQCAQLSWIFWPQSPSLSSKFEVFLIITPEYLNRPRSSFLWDFYAKFGSKMARISGTFFCASATALLFFTLAPPRRAPPFLVRASGAVALKVAQVPSTGVHTWAQSSKTLKCLKTCMFIYGKEEGDDNSVASEWKLKHF